MGKQIHYIWLGSNKKNKIVQECIASWGDYFLNWDITEWNEDNLDIEINKYCSEAYKHKYYAFASDVLRLDIIYRYGGLYFDTDVKVIKDFAPLIEKYDNFVGFEEPGRVNLGLVLYCKEPYNDLIKQLLDSYQSECFVDNNGNMIKKTIVDRFTELLQNDGLRNDNCVQTVRGFTIFPTDYFCPIDYLGRSNFTDNTYSVHMFMGSWVTTSGKLRRFLRVLLGDKVCRLYKKIKFW